MHEATKHGQAHDGLQSTEVLTGETVLCAITRRCEVTEGARTCEKPQGLPFTVKR